MAGSRCSKPGEAFRAPPEGATSPGTPVATPVDGSAIRNACRSPPSEREMFPNTRAMARWKSEPVLIGCRRNCSCRTQRISGVTDVWSQPIQMKEPACGGLNLIPTELRYDVARLHVLPDELDDVIHRSAGLENPANPRLLKSCNILVGNNSSHQHEHVVHLVLLHQIQHTWNDG